MHRLVQHGNLRSQVINVPLGLPELLSDITREVLRCQPTTECLCQFIIDYLNSVIVTRQKAKIAKSIIDRALHIVNDAIDDMCVCDIPKAKAEYMCEAMEECFRRFLVQRRCERNKSKEVIKFKELDMLDELIQKCKLTPDELKISKPVIEEAYQKFVDAYMAANENSEGTDSLYQYFRQREIERIEKRLKEESARKIQSHFRGFLVRKSLFIDNPIENPISVSVTDEMKEVSAATKIQQFFRRHLENNEISESNEIVKNIEEQLKEYPASNISLAGSRVSSEHSKQILDGLENEDELILDTYDHDVIENEEHVLNITEEIDNEVRTSSEKEIIQQIPHD